VYINTSPASPGPEKCIHCINTSPAPEKHLDKLYSGAGEVFTTGDPEKPVFIYTHKILISNTFRQFKIDTKMLPIVIVNKSEAILIYSKIK